MLRQWRTNLQEPILRQMEKESCQNPSRGAWRGVGLSGSSGLFGLSSSTDQKDKRDQTDQMTCQKFVVRPKKRAYGVWLMADCRIGEQEYDPFCPCYTPFAISPALSRSFPRPHPFALPFRKILCKDNVLLRPMSHPPLQQREIAYATQS